MKVENGLKDGRTYKVIYEDGDRIRDKVLVFECFQDDFVVFFNPTKNIMEIIPKARIIRIEEMV